MKLGSKIAVKNVLQVYVTTTMIFYDIPSQMVRKPDTLRQECSSSVCPPNLNRFVGT